MPTEKIAEPDPKVYCRDPEHRPPMFRVYEPGTWRHTCPTCGYVTTFTVPLISYMDPGDARGRTTSP